MTVAQPELRWHAIGRRKTPMVVSFFSIALNYGLNVLFIGRGYGHTGLALSTGFVALANFGLLYWCMRKEIARLETKRLVVVLGKIFIASEVLALVCWGAKWLLLSQWADMGFLLRTTALVLTIALSLGAFCLTASLLRLREMNDMIAAVRRKLGRRAA